MAPASSLPVSQETNDITTDQISLDDRHAATFNDFGDISLALRMLQVNAEGMSAAKFNITGRKLNCNDFND